MKTAGLSDHDMRNLKTGEAGVRVVQCTADEARAMMDDVEDDALLEAIDAAQGDVFSGSSPIGYVVLKITNA